MITATPASFASVPTSALFFDQRLNRHFELFVRDGGLYQSEYELTAEGKQVFRDTRKLECVIGAGQNAMGALVRQGDYLFEAPLSFYSNVHQWALSPGYHMATSVSPGRFCPRALPATAGVRNRSWTATASFVIPRFRNWRWAARTARRRGGSDSGRGEHLRGSEQTGTTLR